MTSVQFPHLPPSSSAIDKASSNFAIPLFTNDKLPRIRLSYSSTPKPTLKARLRSSIEASVSSDRAFREECSESLCGGCWLVYNLRGESKKHEVAESIYQPQEVDARSMSFNMVAGKVV